mmetsp:Transcript_8667/g.21355  ORF Transcript_8667/g.21355 Transcript_8667/m.21355 type:complete len:366 (-) Transcript_8667:131-1228(-)|eukprot:CAMPEP_0114503208 /NCGR_PEP_ID=MMETSP0109-20121206/9520_1 /TAXON_ID=29199 /ORGANISM="Chlorarachnion reptans, Strain CCCM449" /LENGTH=365 /DNA_ID=CAMNT_0001681211 /DNA_START=88 /DNA_END=1185 /DNA_ORIENTATION=+
MLRSRKKKKLGKVASIFDMGSSSSSNEKRPTPQVGMQGKRYGLVKADKLKPALSIFGAADEDDGSGDEKPIDYNVLKYRKQKGKRDREEALKQDPTVFQYDEVFDNIQTKRADQVAAAKKEKRVRKSRYIENLMKKAKEREIEQAIVEERVLLKERKENDHLYGDKGKYVTGAYKKALKERELWMRERERLDAIDEAKAEKAKDGLGYNAGLMSHLLTRKSAGNVDEEELVTIRERVNKKLDERERREREEREKQKEERRKRKAEQSLEEAARVAISQRYGVEKTAKISKGQQPEGLEQPSDSANDAVSKEGDSKMEKEAKPTSPTPSSEQVIHKRNTGEKVSEARARYLARKKAKEALRAKLGK